MSVVHGTSWYRTTHQQESVTAQIIYCGLDILHFIACVIRCNTHCLKSAGQRIQFIKRFKQFDARSSLSFKETNTNVLYGIINSRCRFISHRDIEELGLLNVAASNAYMVKSELSFHQYSMTGDTLQSCIDISTEPQLKPAPKPLMSIVWSPSSLPQSSLEMVKGTEALLVFPYLWMQ